MKQYLTLKEAARYLNVSTETIKRYLKKGLPSYRLEKAMRFFPDDLDSFISRELVLTDGLTATVDSSVPAARGAGCWRVIIRFYNLVKNQKKYVLFGPNNKYLEYYVWVTEEYLEDDKKLPSDKVGAEKFALDYIAERFNQTRKVKEGRSIESISENKVYCRKGKCVHGEEWKKKRFTIILKNGSKYTVEMPSNERLINWINTGLAGSLQMRGETIHFSRDNIKKIIEHKE